MTAVLTPGSPASPGAAAAAPSMSVADVIDTLTYDDPSSPRLRKLVFELQSWVQNSDFAEDFLDRDGLNTILRLMKNSSGSLQGHLLQVVKGLLVYVNAIDQIADSPDLVEKIYGLLLPPADGSPINLSVARSVLELLIVICGVLEEGHRLINDAAKKKAGVDGQPFSVLVPLLSTSDLLTVRNALTFMNILMTKRKTVDDIAAKKLLFRFKECGVLALLKPLSILEDDGIRQQLTVFQRIANFTIPRSWEEAQKYKTMYDEIRKRYEQANESLFVYQQQQSKVRLMKLELAKAQEAIRALTAAMPGASTLTHPTKRFSDGGGLPLAALVSPQIEQVEVGSANDDMSAARKALLDRLFSSADFRHAAEKILTPAIAAKLESSGTFSKRRAGGASRRHYDPDDDDLPPPPDDDDDEDGPPPDDDDDGPPPDDDGPPPAEDGSAAPPGGAQRSGTAAGKGTASADAAATSSGAAPGPSGDAGASTAAGAAPGTAAPSATIGESVVGVQSSAGAGPQTTAVASPTATGAPPPPPPPPPPGRPGGPPPPPPKFGAAAGGGAAKDARVFYKGPAPSKKMRPLHWDKLNVEPTDKESLWARIYAGEVQTEFDYNEFETMFSHKEVDTKEKDAEAAAAAGKPKKITLLDSKTFQNISIMLHKLPSIPTIQRALVELDSETLKRDMLSSMIGQSPNPELKKAFMAQQNAKPVEEYEPPEQFVAMAISMPEFKRRCQAWLFAQEWDDSVVAATQPLQRVHEAVNAVLGSQHLPLYFALLLGFGNMMNHGNALKGNAGAITLGTLSKLEASKDNRGKVSLMQHLLTTVKARYPDALEVHEELKPMLNNVATIKMDDIEKSVTEAEKALEQFKSQCNAVRKALTEQGTMGDDQFAPRMAEFQIRAAKDVEHIKALYEAFKLSYDKLLKYFAIPASKGTKVEEIFAELVPFVEKVKKEALEVAKEKKRQQRKGQRIDSAISNVVGKLQEQMVGS